MIDTNIAQFYMINFPNKLFGLEFIHFHLNKGWIRLNFFRLLYCFIIIFFFFILFKYYAININEINYSIIHHL